MAKNSFNLGAVVGTLSEAMGLVAKKSADMRDALKASWDRQGVLEEQIRRMEYEPITREDWLAFCLDYVDRRGKKYATELAKYLYYLPAETKESKTYGLRYDFGMGVISLALGNDMDAGGGVHFLSGGQYRLRDESPFAIDAPYFFFADQIKAGIRKAFDLMPAEWHFGDARRFDVVFPVLDLARKELDQLKRDEADLYEEAESNGVQLPVKPERVYATKDESAPSRTVSTTQVHGAW